MADAMSSPNHGLYVCVHSLPGRPEIGGKTNVLRGADFVDVSVNLKTKSAEIFVHGEA